jgi:hypothetical protein
MKPFISAFVPQLGSWMTVCTLGDMLLKELTQHASSSLERETAMRVTYGVTTYGIPVDRATQILNNGSLEKIVKYELLDGAFSVKDTPWDLSQNDPISHETWVFSADGIVRDFMIPIGIWQAAHDDAIQVFTYVSAGTDDASTYVEKYTVKFSSQIEFTAYTWDNKPCKYGIRLAG